MNLTDWVARFARLRVLVIGEAMLDSYLGGSVGRVCREAPVPIVALNERNDVPGGAANTAVAVAALGARCAFLSVVGADEAGVILAEKLADAGVETDGLLAAPGRETIVKQRISARGQLLLRLDRGSEGDLPDLIERRLIEALGKAWEAADAVIVSDYGYGICTDRVITAVAQLQRRSPRVLVADAKDLGRWAGAGLSAAKPNYAEAIALLGLGAVEGIDRVEQIVAAREILAAHTGAQLLAVTLDTSGAVLLEPGCEPYRTFTSPAPDSHAAGAGDTFTAAFACALAAGAHSANAADIAAAAAAACVGTAGTTTCTAEMLHERVAGEAKLAGPASVAAQVAAWRAEGKRIVFTNGCFDLLHHGHISYLNRAKALGDVLIVGLNSDASVRALKGPRRPINPEGDRAAVLAALGCVDLVVLFEEATPARLIEAIRPDLFVKGGDYTIPTLPEAPLVQRLGGEVKLLDFLDDRSTTSIIDRIRASYDAPQVAER
ncbi:MAG: D-glycero-beta-D-manno-heptose 1-phosphate adenylyltransferase [Sphingomonas sp.]|uniref:D-glycero-beta-D-manno-heptose 1-phosphate adenylyltransferase n=1 Tax=Sphingomonas sp. TaxID=28214 RepID=UPI0025FCC6A9|nr:D-glycero-beta-D-manno-heptose 1-phosphate adenylyltransferase [Sphingomonas sp.]MBX9880436.1 D-glycero-beta-D-manno-heptose 1-phosphate adenylyltransferase [Sphingomonas sp.]